MIKKTVFLMEGSANEDANEDATENAMTNTTPKTNLNLIDPSFVLRNT